MELLSKVPSEVLAGLVGMALVSACQWILRLGRAWQFRRQYPIAGRYASQYEDRDMPGDAPVVRKAEVTLGHRFGRRIVGEVIDLPSKRTWLLNLVVDRDRDAIHGAYSAVAPGDTGVGVVFLQRRPDGDLRGYWAGYGDLYHGMLGGSWTFHKLAEIRIARLRSRDPLLTQAFDMVNSELGERYLSLDEFWDLSAFADKEDSALILAARHRRSRRLCGVLIVELIHPDYLPTILRGHQEVIARTPALSRIRTKRQAVLRALAVDPKYRRRGIATELVRTAMAELDRLGARDYLAPCWFIDEQPSAAQSMLECLGYRPVADVPLFWFEDSKQEGFDCPVCGNPCNCSARLLLYSATTATDGPESMNRLRQAPLM